MHPYAIFLIDFQCCSILLCFRSFFLLLWLCVFVCSGWRGVMPSYITNRYLTRAFSFGILFFCHLVLQIFLFMYIQEHCMWALTYHTGNANIVVLYLISFSFYRSHSYFRSSRLEPVWNSESLNRCSIRYCTARWGKLYRSVEWRAKETWCEWECSFHVLIMHTIRTHIYIHKRGRDSAAIAENSFIASCCTITVNSDKNNNNCTYESAWQWHFWN